MKVKTGKVKASSGAQKLDQAEAEKMIKDLLNAQGKSSFADESGYFVELWTMAKRRDYQEIVKHKIEDIDTKLELV